MFGLVYGEHIKRSYLVVAAWRILIGPPGLNVLNKQSPNNKNLSTTFEFGWMIDNCLCRKLRTYQFCAYQNVSKDL